MTSKADGMKTIQDLDFFDAAWYVKNYPDVTRTPLSPEEHFLRVGQYLGRKPNGAGQTSIVTTDSAKVPLSEIVEKARHAVAASEPPTNSYEQYKNKIFSKMASLTHRYSKPSDVVIETDYTGPPHATAFDSFISKRQRQDSIKQMLKMLDFGIVAINPQPGVHAARDENGEFIRYKSIRAENDKIHRLPPTMTIHIHAFYPDVVEEMLDYFVEDAKKGKFLVTTTTKRNYELITEIFNNKGFARYQILLIDNKGRDIGPFLDYAIDHVSERDVICHVHTKKSPDVGGSYGEKWRSQLYGALLTQTAIDAFEDDRLGLLFPDTPRSVGWGKNFPFCREIARHFGSSVGAHPGPMPVGNMFFARREVAQAMRRATSKFEWPREPVAYDGTILHAIERMWTRAAEFAGFEWAAIHSPFDDEEQGKRESKSTKGRS